MRVEGSLADDAGAVPPSLARESQSINFIRALEQKKRLRVWCDGRDGGDGLVLPPDWPFGVAQSQEFGFRRQTEIVDRVGLCDERKVSSFEVTPPRGEHCFC